MDDRRFDNVAVLLAGCGSRRQALGLVAGALVGGVLSRSAAGMAAGRKKKGQRKTEREGQDERAGHQEREGQGQGL